MFECNKRDLIPDYESNSETYEIKPGSVTPEPLPMGNYEPSYSKTIPYELNKRIEEAARLQEEAEGSRWCWWKGFY